MEGRAGGDEDLDGVVREVIAAASTTREAVERLRSRHGVTSAELRGGLVKTEPPIVELVVDFAPTAGAPVSRVYDLVEHGSGAPEVVDSHPA